jgi:hypothetical protein
MGQQFGKGLRRWAKYRKQEEKQGSQVVNAKDGC